MSAERFYLQQNWSNSQRQLFYTTTQGSRLMPYDWFIALEVGDGDASFYRTRVLDLGYLPNNHAENNADRLPVGFVDDTDWAGVRHIGLTCAACHTNRIRYLGKTFQIDGAPALADMWGLLVEIQFALSSTHGQPEKFARFAARVLGPKYKSDQATELHQKLGKFLVYWNQLIADSATDEQWGPSRLDAFGMIFNRISAIDLGIRENVRKPDAPVSYPFLWGTSTADKVQWNGSSDNKLALKRLARNAGQVLGVFGEADLRKTGKLRPYYRTSVHRLNQIKLEKLVGKLWSPAWPVHFGHIDREKWRAGKRLYAKHCVRCHEVIPHGKQATPVQVVMTPIWEIGTDPRMAHNATRHTVFTGRIAGSVVIGGTPLPAQTSRVKLLNHVVAGALLSPFRDIPKWKSERSGGVGKIASKPTRSVMSQSNVGEIVGEPVVVGDELDSAGSPQQLSTHGARHDNGIPLTNISGVSQDEVGLLAYKARPLDGIWATAPYLHNGSVPNLYELLLPAGQRSTLFYVGSNEFDPIRVGFQSDGSTGGVLLDTKKLGNSNSGHDSHNDFSEEERWQLVEYLKSL